MVYLVLLVPVAWLFWALFVLLRSVFRLMTLSRMNGSGARVQGRMVSVEKRNRATKWMSGRTTYRTECRETLEFPGPDGRPVSGPVFYSDVVDVDRTGQEVLVIVDRSNPQRFSTPLDGRSIATATPRAQIFSSITMIVVDTGLFVGLLVMIHLARSGMLPGVS